MRAWLEILRERYPGVDWIDAGSEGEGRLPLRVERQDVQDEGRGDAAGSSDQGGAGSPQW
jgi:hypothetical protein